MVRRRRCAAVRPPSSAPLRVRRLQRVPERRCGAGRRACTCHALGESIGEGWDEDQYVMVGIIGPAHGIGGELRVRVETSSPEQRFGKPGVR